MRYLSWTILPFGAAVFLACKLPLWWLCLPMAAVSLCLLLSIKGREHPHRVRQMLVCLGCCLGFAWFGLYTTVNVIPVIPMTEKETAFTATVVSYPVYDGELTTLSLCMEDTSARDRRIYAQLKGDYSHLKPGDSLVGEGRFFTPRSWVHGERYTSDGIFLGIQAEVAQVIASDAARGIHLPYRMGQILKQSISRFFPGESGGLLQGLLTGDRTLVSEDITSDFRRTGLSHVLAVSGLHVGFLVGVFCLLPGYKRRRVLIAVPVLILFALMTGGEPSVWRAVVMSVMMLLAPILGREGDMVTALSVALGILLLQNPYAAESVGLQLSFAAVAGLAVFNSRLYDWMVRPLRLPRQTTPQRRRINRLLRLLAGSVSTSLSAMVFTLPLAAWYFETVSLVGVVANLLCIWVISLVFALGLVVCILGIFIPGLAGVLAIPVRLGLNYVITVTGLLSGWKYSAVRLDNFYTQAWFFFLLFLILLILITKPERRKVLVSVASAGVMLVFVTLLQMLSYTTPDFVVTALDVGQGSCTVFSAREHFVAVDCGGYDAGDKLADYILSAGGDSLELLVLTHYDQDHTSGVARLVKRIQVDTVVVSPEHQDEQLLKLLEASGCEVISINRNIRFYCGTMTLDAMTSVSVNGSDNEGLSLLCTCEEIRVLVTGDMDRAQEAALLERENIGEVDVLVVGHHGSGSSTSNRLLGELAPKCALISVGENQYGMPAPQVLERLQAYRCTYYRTDRNGDITIRYR